MLKPRGKAIGPIIKSLIAMFFLICGSMIWWGCSQTNAYNEKASYEIELNRKYAHLSSDIICLKKDEQERIKCIYDILIKKREFDRNEESLSSQKEAALWSGIVSIATVMALVSSAVGIYLVWITFRETKTANDIARSQVKPQLQLKNKTCIFENEIFADGFVPIVNMSICNMGPTPAIAIAMHAKVKVFSEAKNIYDSAGDAEGSDDTVGPGDTIQNFRVYLKDDAVEILDAFRGGEPLNFSLETTIQYYDIFGEQHEISRSFISRRYNRAMAHADGGRSGYNTIALFS